MHLQGSAVEQPIIIDDDVWIGARVTILPDVHIGSHSIIGAGSIVSNFFHLIVVIQRK